MAGWERLSADTKETCDTVVLVEPMGSFAVGDTFGWNRKPDAQGRCGKKADWLYKSCCGCGTHDMTRRECDEHYQERTQENAERERRFDAEFEIVETKLPGGFSKYERRKRS